MNLEIPRDKYA